MASILENLAALRKNIAGGVCLVAVSKFQPDKKIQEALDAGLRVFGENRVQEALTHWQDRRAVYPDLELHLIGPLQTNKVKEAVALFDVIETVDRPALIDALVKECNKQNKTPRFFVQVNIGEEPQKSGVLPEDLVDLLRYAAQQNMHIDGLMCVPPADEPAGLYFALLRKLAMRHGFSNLSMGMSADYKQAIALGATYIRVGSALFGERI
ncbi:MAG: YggS family pyridoxal phosphate-dependent enzyme [Alphaproteobacteria bacterium]|jgi:pyridoxal phosphate enzyme (YggS family)|nr:YggS family pyridoxal phosphate-dependent enzyme [Alphaproteobacteria bacterium]